MAEIAKYEVVVPLVGKVLEVTVSTRYAQVHWHYQNNGPYKGSTAPIPGQRNRRQPKTEDIP